MKNRRNFFKSLIAVAAIACAEPLALVKPKEEWLFDSHLYNNLPNFLVKNKYILIVTWKAWDKLLDKTEWPENIG